MKKKYPPRKLSEDAIVTRYAPSPTGFIHIGALLACFVEKSFARQTNGILYLRIEDTDTKRTIDNGINTIINGLSNFDIKFDEGPLSETKEIGNYGPYIQSERKEIYHAFIKHLLLNGLAYPCFCTTEELDNIRNMQSKSKKRIGYYGKYAKYRDLSIEEAIKKIENKEQFVIRLKSNGNFDNKIICQDEIRGEIEFPENDLDIVIMKQDGLPTYHFAHLVDDYLMRTTHVIRGDEWLSSLPIHLQLFSVFGFNAPKYAHISPLMKNDEGSLRKLSKRKDPEAATSFYHEQGIPEEAVSLYLATITSSDFEEWYANNPGKTLEGFEFSFTKMNKSGALFDVDKLYNISKNFISRLTADELYLRVANYLEQYDKEFLEIFTKNSEYSKSILGIERNLDNPRKDLVGYKDVKNEFFYMYDDLFENTPYSVLEDQNCNDIIEIISNYHNYFDKEDDKDTWFEKLKDLSEKLGYAREVKEYKKNSEMFKGHVGTVSMVIRFALTKRTKTPDLYEIMQVLGKGNVLKRLEQYKVFLNEKNEL